MERLNQKDASELGLRSYKLVSDKSLADCMLHGSPHWSLPCSFWTKNDFQVDYKATENYKYYRAMAGLGINLSADASLKDVLEGQPSLASHQEDFHPQENAFRACFAQDHSER